MSYRLLIALEVIEFLEALPKSVRQKLRSRLTAMTEEPALFSDFTHHEPDGRRLDVHIIGAYAVFYWDDFADRDLKIIRIEKADR